MKLKRIKRKMADDMHRVIICKYCGKPEYYGEFRWISGHMMCRNCYKADFEERNKRPYVWHDLDGKRPSMNEVEKG